MDEHDKRRVGEQIEPGGRPKAPGRLELLQRFVNTHNHDLPRDWDRIGTRGEGAGVAAARRGSSRRATDLRRRRGAPARAPRGDPGARDRQPGRRRRTRRRRTSSARPRPAPGSASRSTTPGGPPSSPRAAASTAPSRRSSASSTRRSSRGDWSRMKGCRQCEYAFFDRSKNRSAAWCAMSICGNRTKNRAYYRRRRRAASVSEAVRVARERRRGVASAARARRLAAAALLPLFLERGRHRAGQHGPRGGLRDHGAGPEHRRRLRGPARPRLRGVLRDRRARRRALRIRVLGRRRRREGLSLLVGEPAASLPGIHFNFLIILVLAVVATTAAGVADRRADAAPARRLRRHRHARVRRDHRAGRVQRPRDPALRRIAHRRPERHLRDRPDRPPVRRALRRARPAPLVLVRARARRADAARQLPAARLAGRAGVDRAARRRGGGGERGRPDRAHEAAAPTGSAPRSAACRAPSSRRT